MLKGPSGSSHPRCFRQYFMLKVPSELFSQKNFDASSILRFATEPPLKQSSPIYGLSPDLILHGGDLAHGGASPAYIVDRIRELRWEGVLGNTDAMLPMPESLTEFARQTPKLQSLCAAIEEMAAVTRESLGPDRLTWLGSLPRIQILDPIALVHASSREYLAGTDARSERRRVGISLWAYPRKRFGLNESISAS